MKITRPKLAPAIAALALAAGLVAGVAQARPDTAAAPAASEVSGNLVFAHWASSPVETDLLKQVLTNFEKKYPKINVRRRALDPYPDSMLAQFAARKPPDVFYVDSNVAPDWIKQGVLEPLDTFINRYHFRTKPFYPRLLNAFRSGGKTYGFPKDWSPLAMQTNNEMLSKAGVRAPTNWTTLRSVATRLRSSGAVAGGRPICLSPGWDRMLAFIYQNNGAFLSGNKAVVNSPANHVTANFYIGLIQSGLAGTPAQLGVGWCGEALGKEKSAIVFEGNWLLPYMAEQFPSVRFTNNKMVKNKSEGNLAFTVSYSIAKDSKQKAAAWTLLTYLTGREGMRTWTSKGLALPSRSDVKPVAGRSAFLAAAPSARPWQFAPGFAKVMTVAGNELTATLEGKQTVDVMLRKIQDEAARTLRRGGR
ncbi:MAG: extracellular solute-binding protein [Gaiellaceae bacterium]